MNYPRNSFKHAIAKGDKQIGLWNSLCSNIAADVLAPAGYDWVLLDMEHSPSDLRTVLGQLQAYQAEGTIAVVRPTWNDPVLVKPLMDMGATTLLFPMVQSAAEAAKAVASTRYPPRGNRGVSLSQRGNRYGRVKDYVARVEEETCILVQIETREALSQVGEIAAVEGVDGVFFGPADLSADMGIIGLWAMRISGRRSPKGWRPRPQWASLQEHWSAIRTRRLRCSVKDLPLSPAAPISICSPVAPMLY